MKNEEQKYLFTLNEVENSVDSLKVACQTAISDSEFKWKWLPILLHHSLYSMCIACLNQGNYQNVLSSGKDDLDNYSKVGKDVTFKKSERQYLSKGPAYRIIWKETEYTEIDQLPIKPKRNLKNHTNLLVFGQP